MKQLIYKIIALLSVLLGGLGPQVASGQAAAPPSFAVLPTVAVLTMAAPAAPELNSAASPAFSGDVCHQTGESVSLMLWQGCQTLALSEIDLDFRVTVLGQPSYLPELVLEVSKVVWEQGPQLSSSSRGVSPAVIPSGSMFEPDTIKSVSPLALTSPASSERVVAGVDRIGFRSAVMRC